MKYYLIFFVIMLCVLLPLLKAKAQKTATPAGTPTPVANKLVFYALASEDAPINAQVPHLAVSGKLGDISGFSSDIAPYATVLKQADFLKEWDKVAKRGPFTKDQEQELAKIKAWVLATKPQVIGFQLEPL